MSGQCKQCGQAFIQQDAAIPVAAVEPTAKVPHYSYIILGIQAKTIAETSLKTQVKQDSCEHTGHNWQRQFAALSACQYFTMLLIVSQWICWKEKNYKV